MKYVVRIVVGLEIVALLLGVYLKNTGQEVLGTKVIGFSALALMFVVMPLFLVYRFSKSSNQSRSIFNPLEKNQELEDFITGKQREEK